MQNIHPLIWVKKETDLFLWKDFIKKFFLPRRRYPSYFKIKNWQGYLASYEKNLTPEKLINACNSLDKNFFSSVEGDFLVVGINEKENQLNIFNSPSGAFPLFFTAFNNEFIASTDIHKVLEFLPVKKIDLEPTLSYIFSDYSSYPYEKTFIEGVYSLPPGCLLRVNNQLAMKIESITNYDNILKENTTPYSDLITFRNAFLSELEEIVKNLSSIIPSSLFLTTDISAGFDSSLINFLLKKQGNLSFKTFFSYSMEDEGKESLPIVKKFAKKHQLDLETIDQTFFYPFSTQEEIEWNKTYFFPGTHALSSEINFNRVKKEIIKSEFITLTGDGGDELYLSGFLTNDLEKIIEQEIKWVKEAVSFGLEKIFTPLAIKILLDPKRLSRNKIHFSLFAPTALHWPTFAISWQFGEWKISPFCNSSLIKLARKIPKKPDGTRFLKHEIWAGRTDIYLPEQFIFLKKPFDKHIFQMFDKKRKFLEEILNYSLLAKANLIQKEKILKVFQNNQEKNYFKGLLPILINILRLEVFFQANNFKI